MIKVFRNHLCLYTVTTAILSLLQNEIVVGARAEEGVNLPAHSVSGRNIGAARHSVSITGFLEPIYFTVSADGHNIPIVEIIPPLPISGVDGWPIYPNNVGNGFGGGMRGETGSKYAREIYENNKLIIHDGAYYICDNCKEDKIDNRSYKAMHGWDPTNVTAITVKGVRTGVSGKNVMVSSQVADKDFLVGVHVLEKGKVVFEAPTIKNAVIALRATNGVIKVEKGKIEESHEGVDAADGSFVRLKDTAIKTANGNASLLSYDRSKIVMLGGSVDFMNSHGVSSMLGGKVNLKNVKITGKGKEKNSGNHAVLRTDLGGDINLKGTTIHAMDVHGILLENQVDSTPQQGIKEPSNENSESGRAVSKVNLKSSSVTVKGKGSYGVYLRGEKPWRKGEGQKEEISLEEEKAPARLEIVNLDTTNFSVLDDVALYGRNVISGVVSLMKSTLRSESALLKAEKGASITVLAIDSTLEGGAHVDKDSNAELYLGKNSTWILPQNLQKDQRDSSISLVSLMDKSSIKFKRQESSSVDDYQTLRVGRGKGEVYKAKDGAHIHLNTYLNEGGDLDHQKTDRVLIHGDVSGKTMLHVRAVAGSPGGYTGRGRNDQGLSVVQVSGQAEQDSFQLEGGYVALNKLPYQYKLYGYGPQSNLGKANEKQRLVEGSGEFWDFRLESRSIDSDTKPKPDLDPMPSPEPAPEPSPPPKPEVKVVVPQVPTYLLLPNALFHIGLMNVSNQNKRLEALRIASGGSLESRENPLFFVRGYGGNHRYTSNLSALEYGYGGELGYNAIEAGVLLKAIENMYGSSSFGIIGAYEKFSLQPLNVEQSQKSTFDKWSVAAYGGMQHDTGFYVDGLVSYGFFKGDVLTTARGKTATLKGKPLSASLTTGKTFMVGDDGFVFDPQAQVVYQYLQFNKGHDVDGFDIELGNIHQWIARVGGRLTKMLVVTDENQAVSFYGKLNLAHGFGEKKSVHFKDAFQLGDFGSSLETGLGFNAQLSQNFSLHGDLVYQHKLTKAGFSGTSFSGGLRYHF
ncbi:autotransporter outer membrane beta-barrel domain-containing protein [Bartonella tribocorum]|uniref:Autotransporter outer membrane beta-barrel domain-containing protein n=1 Tax=Bartonella tribocorum TaxID=85701 RepID=A0A2M6UT00_9HYPH|nr:autotransporter outer membrane beta-barrel domain-containing protein [Bartonella tribocorum]PIT69281.1 autotransporter outer membrane beta-barrel domain-containing protein [Bartonella tribocorum]